jgi:hydroxymethylpyrimidine/phosphomethylpyrimidine kinase
VVVDPVMVAESGARLLDADAQDALVREILPRATVLTPNLLEARVLAGRDVAGNREQGEQAGEAEALGHELLALGPRTVVVTGGHRTRAVDLYLAAGEDERAVEIAGERHPDGAAHGSGCTHSSILTAQLALGVAPLEAARRARALTGQAVSNGLRELGEGAGPVDVFPLGRMASL